LPAFISALMLAEIVFLDEPFFSGIIALPKGREVAAAAVAWPVPRRLD
jgi:ABC-type amino acid transport system permease subunit